MFTAAREDCWRNKKQMLEFYNSIDVYICASLTEGTPNPCLEAAACGIPILTTAVGNMPEFIENGVNGIFIKRDIGDIVKKIKLVRDNHYLRSRLSTKARERALIWDWLQKAKNYKHMFDAVLEGKGKKSLFHSYEQVYIASADKMDTVLKNCKQFIQVPNRNIDSYVSVIGGMSGLNYLSMMAPHTITFFDINHSAIEYVKCMLEIINISKGSKDFISRVFCRSMERFLKEKNYEELNFYNQNEYLDMKYDKDLYRELMSALSPFSKEMYKKYLRPHLSRKVLSGVKNCRQLVPCYPIYERVPVGGGEENGWNEHGKLVPNLNTYFYGYGWLSSDEAFKHVKTILNNTKKRYIAFDLFRDEIDLLADFSGNVVIHCSNIDDWFSEKWNNWSVKVLEKSIKKGGELTLITTNGGVRHSFLDPHKKAFECIKPYVYGKIVEITHKIPWGFHEFKRDTIIFHDYLNRNNSISDTTIIHNLVGEGVAHNILEKVCRIALQKSNRVIILEHNQKSLDWRNNKDDQSYMTISQLKNILNKITKEINALIHPVINIPGYNDLSRNIVFIVDTYNSHNTGEYDAEIKYRETKNTLKDFENYRERIIANIDKTTKLPYDTGINDNIKVLEKKDSRKKQSEKQKSNKKNKLIYQKSDPLVSVIVPTYNRSESLLTAVQSILNQTFKKLEIIVVNDAGQNEENLIAGLNANENITYVRHCRNKGLAAARNTGIKIANGKYIAYLDDDDIFYYNHLEKLVNILENTEYKVAYTDAYRAYYLKENDNYTLKNKDLPYSFDFDYDRILIGNFVPVLCFMHEKACFDDVGLFDETLTSHEDWDLWIRLSRKYKFYHMKEVTGEYTWKTDGTTMTSGKSRDMVDTLEKIYRKHRELVRDKPHIAEAQRISLSERKKTIGLTGSLAKCSLIVPLFNNVSLTRHCLDALFKVTPRHLFEVIIVDNASTDGTKEYLKFFGDRIKVITNIENKGFAVACNQGAKLANGEFLVFLNNDTVPVAGWLESMVALAEKDDEIGVIGSKLLYPDGTIQHAGIELINGVPDHPFRNAPGDMPEANTMRELDMVTGACLLIKKEIFDECNGFDENYRNGVEDVDLCLKVRDFGFKVVYNPQSTLYHHEGKTAGRFDHVRENLELFFKRWGQRFDKKGKFIQENKLEKTRITWEGSQFVNHSLALVNREMCRCLIRRSDIELSLVPYEPHQFDASVDLSKYGAIGSRLNLRLSAPADVYIRHQWPPNFNPPLEGHWIMIQPWEYGALPKDWVEPMRSQVDELWVPSNYVREVYIESGIPASKVFVIPNGVDYENFHPKAEPKSFDTEKSFKFLFVGGTITRKGIDVLLDAYSSAFSCVDDVSLVIKDMGADTFYRGQSGAERIEAIQKREDAPEILYLKEDLPDKKMAGLYTACDCLVHPYRGEGFGLPVAEAMACGLPVLITRGGACDDYCNEKNSFLIESNRRPIAMNDTELCNTGWVLEPDKYDLIRRLRFLYENRDEGRKIGAVAAREIRELVSWEKSADLVVQRIKEIKNKPIIRLQVNGCQEFNEDNNSDLLLYTAIQERISIGDIEGAIANLEDLIGNKPELAVAYNDLGVLYHRLGENKLAVARYRRAIDLEPNNTNYRKNLADILAVTFGELEEALQHYVAVLESDNKDVEALLATGHICARLERYDDAAEFYEKVLEIEPNNSDAANWLGNMREKVSTNGLEGNLNECYQALITEIDHEDLAEAVQKIENFIEMYPYYGQAHNDLGVLYYKNEYKTKVLACYLKAVELEPENVTFRKNLADFLYVEEGRVEEALENYVAVLRIKPDDVETLLITGHICTAIEQFEDAMGFYHKVLDLEPQNFDARQNLEALEKRQISMLNQEVETEKNPGDKTQIIQAELHASNDDVPIIQASAVEDFIKKADSLFQQERIDQAIDIFLKAIAVNPLDGSTYIKLAWQLVNHGRHENALEVLSEIPENQPEALVKKKLLLEGYCQEGMGSYAVAKKCGDRVLEREPENAKAQNLLGILAYRNGEQETAEQHFKRAIELSPEYGEPHTNLGALVWEKGDPKMALEHYERGFSISPTDIDVANAYHEVVTAAGEYKRAEKVARSVLNQYPQCRKVLYLLIDTLIRQEKTEEALNELENALSTFGIDEGLLDTALALRERVGKTKKTGSAKKHSVSLCMIVKDEETNLARCLASVKPIVDEMVVIDTGSTDRTKDIAAFFGARVYDFEWSDDFAEARNFSLSKAKGSWILILDADEKISQQDYKRFRKLVAKKPSGLMAYSIITRNYCNMANTIGWIPNSGQYISEEAGLGWLSSEKVRLFSNSSQIKFEGVVHEMVDPVLKRLSVDMRKCHIPVHHYGRLDGGKLARKDQAYYEIGRKKLLKNGGDIGTVRELAIQATVLERNSEAIELWQKFLSMEPGEAAVADAYVNMVSAYIRMHDYSHAHRLARKAVSLNPQMKEAQYNLGITELYSGNVEAAFNTFKKLRQSHPDFPPVQFLLAASNYCLNGTADVNCNINKLKKSAFGPALTYSFAELAEGLMAANQHQLAFKLLKSAMEDEIISKSMMTLYADCVDKIKDSDGLCNIYFQQGDALSEAVPDYN